jgi:hypothetical protein
MNQAGCVRKRARYALLREIGPVHALSRLIPARD